MAFDIKNFFSLGFLFRMKFIKKFCENKSVILHKGPCIYYLDAPDYGNLGDQAIAVAIKKYAQKEFPNYVFVEILYNQLPAYSRCLKKNIKEEDVIFLTGGGNMGNVYRIYEATRRYVIEQFKKNTIIVFPQSINYTDTFFGKVSFWRSKIIYSKHKKLIICAREKNSYEIMVMAYKRNKVILVPDIAFSLLPSAKIYKSNTVGICFRDDGERALSDELRMKITQEVEFAGRVSVIDTIDSTKKYTETSREKEVMEKITQIAQCKVLITDRLHAMIFAIITQTPCIVIKNNNYKITGTVEWLKEQANVVFFDEHHSIIEQIATITNNSGIFEPNYELLDKTLKEELYG